MNKEIIVTKDGITIPYTDTVTIPRCEYNALIAAKTQCDMILAVAGADGYGCADTVKGMRALDKYRSALTASEDRFRALQAERDEQIANMYTEIGDLKGKLKKALGVSTEENTPEENTDA